MDSRGVASRFTFDPADDSGAVWSPDGSRIAWRNGGTGNGPGEAKVLFQKASGNVTREEKLPLDSGPWVIDDWLPDGSGLLFHDGSVSGSLSAGSVLRGLRLLPLTGNVAPRVIGDARSMVTHARVSPDGHWVAFTINDAGKSEIYIQNFPTPTGRWRVSPGGGIQPVWRRDGKELFYVALTGS